MSVRYVAGIYSSDPSEIVRPVYCRMPRPWRIVNQQLIGDWRVDAALKFVPRDKFDYVWLIDVPPFDPELTRGMTPVWKGRRSMLYSLHP
jgi:hypothetical protein